MRPSRGAVSVFLHQIGGAVEFLLRQKHLAFVLGQIGVRLIDRALRLLGLRLRALERRLQIAGIHAGQNLPGFDQIALIRQHFRDARRIFGVDIDFVSLKPPVAEGDARR
jgi:hypothetical protein